jgi:type IV pilus assembly protein PilM
VRQLAADELPMPMYSAVLDYVPIGIVETPTGPRQRVVVAAARRDMIEAVLAAVTAAGLTPRGIDLSAFAMIRILGRGQPDSALYLSVGGVTILAVVVDGVCTFARVSGAGLESMAIELAERRDLTLEHARMWLGHVGLERDLEEIDGDEEIVADSRAILSERTRRLAGEVRQSLEFHQSQTVSAFAFERTILTGAAAAIAGFADALAAELAMPVEMRSVAADNDLFRSEDLAGATIAAGLAVEQVPA